MVPMVILMDVEVPCVSTSALEPWYVGDVGQCRDSHPGNILLLDDGRLGLGPARLGPGQAARHRRAPQVCEARRGARRPRPGSDGAAVGRVRLRHPDVEPPVGARQVGELPGASRASPPTMLPGGAPHMASKVYRIALFTHHENFSSC